MFGWQHPEMCRAEIAIKTSKRQLKKKLTLLLKTTAFFVYNKKSASLQLTAGFGKEPKRCPGSWGKREGCVCVCVCVCVRAVLAGPLTDVLGDNPAPGRKSQAARKKEPKKQAQGHMQLWRCLLLPLWETNSSTVTATKGKKSTPR